MSELRNGDDSFEMQIARPDDLSAHTQKILQWIRGPGEKLLYSQKALPRSFEEATEIRKAHEQFEFKCMQALAMYAQLQDPNSLGDRSISEIEGLDSAVKDFLQELQKRRIIVVSFYTFYRILNDLETGIRDASNLCENPDTSSLKKVLETLNNSKELKENMENLYSSLVHESNRLRPLTASDPHVAQEIELTKKSIKDRLTETLQKLQITILKLQKTEKILNCENDIIGAIQWLSDMSDILLNSYLENCIGITPIDSSQLLDAHLKLESKAKDTFTFIQNLSEAYQNMCRSQQLSADRIKPLLDEAQDAWQRLALISKEIRDRLEVGETFYKNVDTLLAAVEDLIINISKDLNERKLNRAQIREKYIKQATENVNDFVTTKEYGFVLLSRIKTRIANELVDIYNSEKIDSTQAVINMKLLTLWIKILELDYYLGDLIRREGEIEDIVTIIKIQMNKFYERMAFHEEQWQKVALSIYLSPAEKAIDIHLRARHEIDSMWEKILKDLEPFVKKSPHNTQEMIVAVNEATQQAENRKKDWDKGWKAHDIRLRRRYDVLKELHDYKIDLEDWWQKLLELRDKEPYSSLSVIHAINEGVTELKRLVPERQDRLARVLKLVRDEVGSSLDEELGDYEESWQKYKSCLELLDVLIAICYDIVQFLPDLETFTSSWEQRLDQCQCKEDENGLVTDLERLIRRIEEFDVDTLHRNCRELHNNSDDSKAREVSDRLKFYLNLLKSFDVTKKKPSNFQPRLLNGGLQDVTTYPEKRCILVCNFDGFTSKPDTAWFKDGRRIYPDSKHFIEVSQSSASLTITPVEELDAGTYKLVLQDPRTGKQLESEAYLRIVRHPVSSLTITKGLNDIHTSAQSRVEFLCEFASDEPPEVTWLRNGIPLSSFDTSENWESYLTRNCATLATDAVQRIHEGEYTCLLKDRSSGDVLESSARLVVSCKPKFVQRLESKAVLEGEPVLLQCQLETRIGQHEVIWTLNDHSPPKDCQIDNRDGVCAIMIPSARSHHEGTYRCLALTHGGESSTTGYLTVQDSRYPNIIKPMQSKYTLDENDSLRLEVEFDASPIPEVNWYKNNATIIPERRIKISTYAKVSTLTVDDVRESDSGAYSVIVKNPLGSDKNVSEVIVNPLSNLSTPVFATPPADQEVQEGESARFTCSILGNPKPRVSWRKSGREILPSEDFKLVEDFHEHTYSLIIRQCYSEDRGQYDIIAENKAGKAHNKCYLNVKAIAKPNTAHKPYLLGNLLKDQCINPGDKLKLSVKVGGYPAPQATWYKDNQELIDSNRIHICQNNTEYVLEIDNFRSQDAGIYRVKLSNDHGEIDVAAPVTVAPTTPPGDESDVDSEIGIVDGKLVEGGRGSPTDNNKRTNLILTNTVVCSPPEFSDLFGDIICKEGETVILSFKMTGLPKPMIWWNYNGDPLYENSKIKFEHDSAGYNSLVIRNIRKQDEGRYSVTGENNSGVATCSSLILVEQDSPADKPHHTSLPNPSRPRAAPSKGSPIKSSTVSSHPKYFNPIASSASLSSLFGPGHSESIHDVRAAPRNSQSNTRDWEDNRCPFSPDSYSGVLLNTLPDFHLPNKDYAN